MGSPPGSLPSKSTANFPISGLHVYACVVCGVFACVVYLCVCVCVHVYVYVCVCVSVRVCEYVECVSQ